MIQVRALLTAKKRPSEDRTAHKGGLADDCALADGAAGLVQRRAENSQENYRCNKTLEGKEVLDFGVRYT